MKRWICSLAALLAAGFAASQGFVINNYDVAMTASKNGSLTVVETLDVQFTESHHGIFRDIPIALDNGRGSVRQIFPSGISTGSDHSSVSIADGIMHIKIGDANTMLDAGTTHQYKIQYTVDNAINWFDSDTTWKPYAEIYWNVTGDQWQVPIQHTHLMLSFPVVSNVKDVRAKLFVGAYGSTNGVTLGQAGLRERDPRSGLSASLTSSTLEADMGPLDPYEGVTAVLDVPSAVIQKPTTAEQIRMFLLPNMGFTLPIFALVIGLLAFLKFGKDPAAGPMVVEFEPPDNLSGPEAGTFLDERVDQRDLAAGIVSLAVKGYLHIAVGETGTILHRPTTTITFTTKAAGSDLTDFETELLSLLKLGGDTVTDVDLGQNVAPELSTLKSMLYDSLVKRGYYLSSPQTSRVIMGVGFVVILGLLGLLMMALSPLHQPLPALVGGVLSLPIIYWVVMAAPRRTSEGAKAWARLRGFEDFMRRARAPELEWLSKKHPDAAIFEQYLPHAVAFGLTSQWAQAFEGIVHAPPNWYSSTYGMGWNPIFFASSLDSTTSNISRSAFTPPRSSGASGGSSGFGGGGFSGGGGGFSGGGFGGGGGGSW